MDASNIIESPLKNFTVGALLTDETFALASSHGSAEGNINYKWMLGVNITAYLNGILETGLDFVLSAMFIGLLISSARENIIYNMKLMETLHKI